MMSQMAMMGAGGEDNPFVLQLPEDVQEKVHLPS